PEVPLRHAYGVEIGAPIEAVWGYAGDSHKANEWSVYFDHISLLPESPVPDGQVGALRRCYRRADETGVTWDEEVVALEPHRAREIRTYALQGFRPLMQDVVGWTQYRVAQHYEALGAEQTRLTFSTDVLRPALPPARWLFGAFADEVVRIFRLNLENIAAAIEAEQRGEVYVRPHPYEPTHSWDPRF
ncbi:MAG: SRPBCC family protein, partial [Bacteroidota bacterium]